MLKLTTTLALLLVLLIPSFCVYAQADPGDPGPLLVTKQDYDFGDQAFAPPSFSDLVEVTGNVHHPSDMSAGPFPVLLFLHGRHSPCYDPGSNFTSSSWPCGSDDPIPSYEGYDYLASNLASHGYIVISISANSISATDNSHGDSGMGARAELIQHHLELWETFNTTGGAPFGTQFVGKLDLSNVGTMGHSRGGEGVITHALLNRSQGSPFGVNAVLTLAPVDFNNPVLNDIPVMNIAPYCDGDVSSLHGVHYYDDARYNELNDTTPKYNVMMLGANHNYYNTVWTPGLFPAGASDDWGFEDFTQNDPHCGTGSGSNERFSDAVQRASLLAYAGAFFRTHIGGETDFLPLLQVDDITPPASSMLDSTEVFVSYHAPSHKRVDLNRIDTEGTETSNTFGAAVSSNGLTNYDVCGDDTGELSCLGLGTRQEPHSRSGGSLIGLSQKGLEWNSSDDWYDNAVPAHISNWTQVEAIQFRVALDFVNSSGPLDFEVELRDNSGGIATVTVGNYTQVLFDPPGNETDVLPKLLHNTIKIPLTDFTGVDLSDMGNLRFNFNQSVTGSVFVTDIALTSSSEVFFEPIADFTSDVTETCTGIVAFTDLSEFNPNAWNWDFGDGNTSTDQHPIHAYTASGTYTVTMNAVNPTGQDTVTKTSYVIVNIPAAPSGIGDTVCSAGNATLTGTAVGGGTLEWYDAPIGGSQVGAGTSTTQSVSTTTDFYVQEVIQNPIQNVGPPDNLFGGGSYFDANDLRGLFFDAYAPFILESVKVYAGSSGNRTIQVLDGDGGSVIHSTTVNIPAGESRVTLNFDITPYSGYYLKVTGGLVDLFRINDGSPTYPYTLPGIVSLTGSNVSGTPLDYYYFFFDWEIREADCISPRVPVTAYVDTTVGIVASVSDSAICPGDSVVFNATGGSGYIWDAGINSGVPFSPTSTDLFTVSGTIGTCPSSDSVLVIVHTPPAVSTSGNITISPGQSTNLSATGGGSYSWTPTAGLDDPNSATPIATPDSTTTYTVLVTDTNGCSSSEMLTVTIDSSNTIAENQLDQFLVYPNPSSNKVYIRPLGNNTSFKTTLYSLGGSLIEEKTVSNSPQIVLDIGLLARGTYLIRIESEDYVQHVRLVRQ